MTIFSEKPLFREGILKPGPFSRNYELHCYEPDAALRSFVEHYFISRRLPDFDPDYFGSDVLSQPVVSLFFKPDTAYIEGPTTGTRSIRANETPFYAGVQFKPGGFFPYWKRPVSELTERAIPVTAVVPGYTNNYVQTMVSQADDQRLLAMIEANLLLQKPQHDPNIDLINRIFIEIEREKGSSTVGKVAASFDMSERTLQHLFNVYVGVGVKWAIMRVRFLEIIKVAREQERPDWTLLAAEFGYSDQSHFIHDFKRLTGAPPSQFMLNGGG